MASSVVSGHLIVPSMKPEPGLEFLWVLLPQKGRAQVCRRKRVIPERQGSPQENASFMAKKLSLL